MSHANALLTPKGRLRLAQCVVEDGWSLRRAAERFQVSGTTAARWAARYRAAGADGMVDRSSRPVRSPQRTSVKRERRIIAPRVNRRWGPARIGFLLGTHPSTVHRVLSRFGLARLSWLDRVTGRVIRRCEHHSPGSWSTWKSRSSDGSRTAAATASPAAPRAIGTRPAAPRTGDRATPSYRTRLMTNRGLPIASSWPMKRRTLQPGSGNAPTLISNPAESPSNGY